MNTKMIPGFEDYTITKEGQVFHNNGRKRLKTQLSVKDIPFVSLRKNNKYHVFSIAKLVAMTYIGTEGRKSSDVVCYKDGNNHNFHVDNLYWSSRSEAYKQLYNRSNAASKKRLYKLRKKICKQVVSMHKTETGFVEVKKYDSIANAANDVGVSSASLIRCLKNQRYMSAGYYWKYVNEEE